MNITDIIGKGKSYEPPFHTDIFGCFIYDKNNEIMLDTRHCIHLAYALGMVMRYGKTYAALANRIVKFLNER